MAGIPTLSGASYLWNLFADGEEAAATYYLALINSVQPGSAALGNELDEPPFADYGRAKYENLSGNWYIQNGFMTNQFEFGFPMPSSNWGVINYWALCDDITGGRALFVGDAQNLTVVSGVQPVIAPGGMQLNISLPTFQVKQ